MMYNRQEKTQAGNATQNIHPHLKQSALIHIQTHTCHQSCINSLIYTPKAFDKQVGSSANDIRNGGLVLLFGFCLFYVPNFLKNTF